MLLVSVQMDGKVGLFYCSTARRGRGVDIAPEKAIVMGEGHYEITVAPEKIFFVVKNGRKSVTESQTKGEVSSPSPLSH